MYSRLVISLLIILMSSAAAFAGDDVPSWLQQATTTAVPVYDKDVSAVVLLNDQRITVSDDGHLDCR